MEELSNILLLSCLTMIIFSTESSASTLNEVYSWKVLDFQYPNDSMRQQQIESGQFNQDNIIPTGVEEWGKKLFVTLPRIKGGIPATLTYINMDGSSEEKSPKLIPYPDWDTHQLDRDGPKIISVHHVNVDACDRLWMFDTGLADYLGDQKQILPPRILVYDLRTDELINAHEVRKDHRKTGTCMASLASVVVDVTKDRCDEAFAYVSDSDAAGFVAYDFKKNVSWRVEEPFYRFDALSDDENYLDAGIFGIGLKPVNAHYSTYFFHPLCNLRDSGSTITFLQNQTIEDANYRYTMQVWQGPETQYLNVDTDIVARRRRIKNAKSCSIDDIFAVGDLPVFPSDMTLDKNGNVWVLWNNFSIVKMDEQQDDITVRISTAPLL